MNRELYNALNRLNYQIDKVLKKMPSVMQDIEPNLEINFGESAITASGRISRKILKNPDSDLLERIEGATDFVKGMISEFENIPSNIYDIWQNAIDDYFRWVSEMGADAVQECAPETTENIKNLTKNSDKEDFWHAVNKWRVEREKVLAYADEMQNAEPYTDF